MQLDLYTHHNDIYAHCFTLMNCSSWSLLGTFSVISSLCSFAAVAMCFLDSAYFFLNVRSWGCQFKQTCMHL